MPQQPVSLAFRYEVVLALAVTMVVVVTFVHPASDTAATSSDPIYRPQHLLLY